ncbi:MAG: recombinase family protein [Hyphomonadaceae bacterium]
MKRRCAIYTRKSTDEGLDKAFNSLDAQREACEAFILSQAGEGWSLVKDIYDDGGYSGGTMERPGLKRLIADVEAGRVDVIVVYKVDRLTRSLADFSRIIEILDRASASFVSVTQAFNTTNSMGRLTLNVLLSFAQFEREVTGERIRDKIAASKAKGMWMGGNPPLGYDVQNRSLCINPTEAETVRTIFNRYLSARSVYELRDALAQDGIRSKAWVSRSGRNIGGATLSHGALYHILSNRIYIGEIVHRGKTHRSLHQPILDLNVFETAQRKLADRVIDGVRVRTKGHRLPLLGKLFDDAGHPMTHAHANKAGRRYFYYVSTALNARKPAGSLPRVSAVRLHEAVAELVAPRLSPDGRPDAQDRVAAAVQKIVLSRTAITIVVHAEAAAKNTKEDASHESYGEDVCRIEASIALGRMRSGKHMIAPRDAARAPSLDRALVRAVVQARQWAQQLAYSGEPSIQGLAKREGVCPMYLGRLLPLGFLAPDLVEDILDGHQPTQLRLSHLVEQTLPASWTAQRAFFAEFR